MQCSLWKFVSSDMLYAGCATRITVANLHRNSEWWTSIRNIDGLPQSKTCNSLYPTFQLFRGLTGMNSLTSHRSTESTVVDEKASGTRKALNSVTGFDREVFQYSTFLTSLRILPTNLFPVHPMYLYSPSVSFRGSYPFSIPIPSLKPSTEFRERCQLPIEDVGKAMQSPLKYIHSESETQLADVTRLKEWWKTYTNDCSVHEIIYLYDLMTV
jgi:hypothetical protein